MTNFTEKLSYLIGTDRHWDSDAQNFFDSYAKSSRKEVLTPYTVEDFAKMICFKVVGFDCGFALKECDLGYDIVAVHNNTGIPSLGVALIEAAIRNGGNVLDCYEGFLSKFYQKMGFVEYDRYPFDIQYANEGFFERYGACDVICMKLA